jgi:hypothetical protein
MSKHKVPNFLRSFMKLPATHPARQPGAVTVAEVQHDEWCRHFKGGVCNCNPNLIMKTTKP